MIDVMKFLNEIALKNPKAISFASGRPDANFFNLNKGLSHFNEFIKTFSEPELNQFMGQYSSAQGLFLQDWVDYLAEFQGIQANIDEIMLCSGTQEAMLLSLLSVVLPNQTELYTQNPAYIGMLSLAQHLKISIQEYQFQELKNKQDLLYLISDFQNPTGKVLTIEERNFILNQTESTIFEDNAYGNYWFEEKLNPLVCYDTDQKVIYAESFSKTLFPGLRFSVVKGPKEIIQKMIEIKGYTTVNNASLSMFWATAWLRKNKENIPFHIENQRLVIKNKSENLIQIIQEIFSPHEVKINFPSGGFFMILEFPFLIQLSDVQDAVENFGVIFTPVFFFDIQQIPNNQIRLAYSSGSIDDFKTGILQLKKWVDSKMKMIKNS